MGNRIRKANNPHVHFPSPTPLFLPLAHPPDTAVLVRAIFCQNEPTNKHHTTAGMKGKSPRLGSQNAIMAKHGWAEEKISWRGRGGKRNKPRGISIPIDARRHMKNVRCYGWGGAGEPINVHPPNSSQPSAMRCDAPEAATTSTAPQMSCLWIFLPKGWCDCWQLVVPEQALWPCPCVCPDAHHSHPA